MGSSPPLPPPPALRDPLRPTTLDQHVSCSMDLWAWLESHLCSHQRVKGYVNHLDAQLPSPVPPPGSWEDGQPVRCWLTAPDRAQAQQAERLTAELQPGVLCTSRSRRALLCHDGQTLHQFAHGVEPMLSHRLSSRSRRAG